MGRATGSPDWLSSIPHRRRSRPARSTFRDTRIFKGLGAIGFSMGAVQIDEPSPSTGHGAMTILLSQLRQAVYHRIIAALPGREGAVAAALITGERGRIDNAVLSAMRSSGLAHLLAISGLHIGLIAGCIFFFVRGSLALVPAIALRYPIKKWAAIVALLGAFGYLLLAGATIPTQRAFLMIALVLLAVMTDRTGVSMRLVAWAATVVLLFEPQSILGASFQLSFAAVVALVATYETLRGRFSRSIDLSSWWQRPALYVGGVALTSLVAGLATGPFAVANFNRFAPLRSRGQHGRRAGYGVLGHALGFGFSLPHAFWPRAIGPGANGLGNFRNTFGGRNCKRMAWSRPSTADTTGMVDPSDRDGRYLALSLAKVLAACRCALDCTWAFWFWFCHNARHPDHS